MKSLSTLDMYCESKYHLFSRLSECHQEDNKAYPRDVDHLAKGEGRSMI